MGVVIEKYRLERKKVIGRKTGEELHAAKKPIPGQGRAHRGGQRT